MAGAARPPSSLFLGPPLFFRGAALPSSHGPLATRAASAASPRRRATLPLPGLARAPPLLRVSAPRSPTRPCSPRRPSSACPRLHLVRASLCSALHRARCARRPRPPHLTAERPCLLLPTGAPLVSRKLRRCGSSTTPPSSSGRQLLCRASSPLAAHLLYLCPSFSPQNHRRRLPYSPALPPPLAAQLARPSRVPCWSIFSSPAQPDRAAQHAQAQRLRVLAAVLLLPLLRECFAVSLPKSLLCAVKTEEPPSRSRERLLRRDDYVRGAANTYVYDYLDRTATSTTLITSTTPWHATKRFQQSK
ncbi:uncharacterized protein LOC112270575 isoform X2 [Brachypodium distachyon]|uniref:Uncharacterized protein n=1 Tax=Brachypodium distachyon TaxID=15368 RepID=A0A0Q3IJV7_BRADI|nr:uncharacterized protein LOC112270575 isoform X2 [Brachypodium distachyon]KQK06083.1 hypothetical protein BRADI_2g24323v3 [Brachypodium distachyon]|eukprot:XP_024314068.1 uncharacterized protein LOC112270575 isoform X2 [Brachypodium distachyon]